MNGNDPNKSLFNRPKLSKSQDSFRILSFNIAHGRARAISQFLTSKNKIENNCKLIGDFLKTTDADLVLLQEIDFKALWTNYLNQRLLINYDNHFPFFQEGQNNLSGNWVKMDYGNSILSKHEILSHENFPFEKKRIGGKGFQLAKIKWQGKDLSIINLHLHPYSKKMRNYQIDMLQDALLPIAKSYIIGGDFNMPINDPILQSFIKKLNLNHPINESHTYEFLHWKERLDYILASPDIHWLQTEIIKTKLSDHLPLSQDFVWKKS